MRNTHDTYRWLDTYSSRLHRASVNIQGAGKNHLTLANRVVSYQYTYQHANLDYSPYTPSTGDPSDSRCLNILKLGNPVGELCCPAHTCWTCEPPQPKGWQAPNISPCLDLLVLQSTVACRDVYHQWRMPSCTLTPRSRQEGCWAPEAA